MKNSKFKIQNSKFIMVMNWKMNPVTLKEAENLFQLTANLARELKNTEVIICPPFTYLFNLFKIQNSKFKIRLGAQNCFWKNKGAYTGEISPLMLKNLGVQYVILGHSERRDLGETNEIINKKIKACLKTNLKVIFCVGEKERDEKCDYLNFIKEEIEEGLKGVSLKELKDIIIAYEPIWAISSEPGAEPVTPDDLLTIAIFIRKILFTLYKTKKIFDLAVLYGGSVNGKNFKDFLNVGDISGFLVGGASLKPKKLSKILQ